MKIIYLALVLIGASLGINAQEYVQSKTSIPSNNANNAIGLKNAIWRNSQMAPTTTDNFPNNQNWWSIFQTQFTDTRYDAQLAFGLNSEDLWLRYNFNGNWKKWKKIILTDYKGNVGLQSLTVTGNNSISSVNGFRNMIEFTDGSHAAMVFHPGLKDELMFGFHTNGNFYWGTGRSATKPNFYSMYLSGETGNLGLKGKLTCNEVEVKVGGWSDFVFDNDYKLKDLEEVESYIEENNHLPDIPSEKEVIERGINLGNMDAKLLQKIEELTLYVIEQNKNTNILLERVNRLEIENKQLKKN